MSQIVDEQKETDALEQALVQAAADADARERESEKSLGTAEIYESTSSNTESRGPNEPGTRVVKRKRNAEKEEECPVKEKRLENAQSVSANSRSLEKFETHAKIVAEHYNALEEKGLDERRKSRIVYMRNFNNWIKSMLINEYLSKIKTNKKHSSAVRVMDMCCGKGGDLLKWRKGNITHLICTDIASISLEQCESRYREMCSRSTRDRNPGKIYTAEFIAGDSTRVRLRERFKDPSVHLDLVSCQFSFHYSFESLAQAECMLRNAAECLEPGGFFIGTIPDAYDLVSRWRKAKSDTYGNDVYRVTFHCDKTPPLFGAMYNFHLDGVVNCPEFLVYFPLFVKLAKRYGLKLVNKERFEDFYKRMKSEGAPLMGKMQSLEVYPPYSGVSLLGSADDDYRHVESFIKENNISPEGQNRIGTLSKSEWEAASVYCTFAFQKVKNTWSSEGKPVYDFS